MTAATLTSASAQESRKSIRVGLSGCGQMGQQLVRSALAMPAAWGVAIAALYDPVKIKRDSLGRALNATSGTGGTVNSFEKLLEKELGLDALIIASPDHVHAKQAIAAMEAGLAVYCEVPLAHTLEDARAMIAAQRKTGRPLQAGYQRRSNPRYVQLRNAVIRDRQLLGRITRASSQWNRSQKDLLRPKITRDDEAAIRTAGYADLIEWANWRNYRKFSMGAASSLGAYGVDVINWMLDTVPDRVIAAGGTDYYDGKEGRPLMETPDNFNASFGYKIGGRTVRCNCQVNLDSESGFYYEKVMGLEGWAAISEAPQYGNEVFRNRDADDSRQRYDKAVGDGVLQSLWSVVRLTETSRLADTVDTVSSPTDPGNHYYALTANTEHPPHHYHLLNFFSTLWTGGPQAGLACPAEEAWKTLVCMTKLQEAIEARREVPITAADFAV